MSKKKRKLKRIKDKERLKAGAIYCYFCKQRDPPEKVHAVWKIGNKSACDHHKGNLTQEDKNYKKAQKNNFWKW